MNYDYLIHRELREEIRMYLKSLRERSKQENKKETRMLEKVLFTEPRKGFFDNEYVERLVIFLRGTGCSFASKTGGCTFCGFYNATNFGLKIPDEKYIQQIKDVINDKQINFNDYKIICLYNDGSMLREEEISFKTLIEFIKILNEKENVKKIVIESRVEDITETKLAMIRAATNKEIEIAVGFESANPLIRDLCINKSFENSVFEENCDVAKKYNISIIPLLILKPPFLSEKEAIEDYINSLRYLEQFNFKRIDMELPTVEAYTLVYDLWIKNMYKPAKYWSAIEILKRKHGLGLKTPIYISPPNYSVSAEAKATNCDKCNASIYKAFEDYNRYGDISIFDEIECSCKAEWELLLNSEKYNEELPERIKKILNELEGKMIIKEA